MSPLDSISATLPDDLDARLAEATTAFWRTRRQQQARQGAAGQVDQGARAAVTGGKQMAGFEELLADLLANNGIPASCIFRDQKLELPGYYRATKTWDLLVVHQGELLAVVELKSHIGSFGNNINNRVEEAVGSSSDLWTAYRDGAFGTGRRPWLGYLILLESSVRSQTVVRSVKEPHFPVFPAFRHASYVQRYGELCRRLVRERLYSEATLLLSEASALAGDIVQQPYPELSFRSFAFSLIASIQIGLASNPARSEQ